MRPLLRTLAIAALLAASVSGCAGHPAAYDYLLDLGKLGTGQQALTMEENQDCRSHH